MVNRDLIPGLSLKKREVAYGIVVAVLLMPALAFIYFEITDDASSTKGGVPAGKPLFLKNYVCLLLLVVLLFCSSIALMLLRRWHLLLVRFL